MLKRGSAALSVVLIIVGIILVVGLWQYRYFLLPASISNPAMASAQTPVSTWKTYAHTASSDIPYDTDLSFQYPPDYSLTAYSHPYPDQQGNDVLTLLTATVTGQSIGQCPAPEIIVAISFDPPDTHTYENALASGQPFITSSGLTGTDLGSTIFEFYDGEKDPIGNKMIIQLETTTPDEPGTPCVGYNALAEKIASTLSVTTTSDQESLDFDPVTLPGTAEQPLTRLYATSSFYMFDGKAYLGLGANTSIPLENLILSFKQPTPTPQEIAMAKTWLLYNGFTIASSATGNGITFNGTPDQVESAFNIKITTYFFGNVQCYASPDNQVLPSYLASFVEGIIPFGDCPFSSSS